MKKLLLSALCFAGVAAMASADATLDVNNATNLQGTVIDERPAGTNGDKDNGEAKHVQPLESLEIDGYKCTFVQTGTGTAPAYYYAMSTATAGQCTIRLYGNTSGNDCKMTITAPAGENFASITFVGTNGKAGGTVEASVGEASMTKTTEVTWTNASAVNEVSLTFKQNFRITKMEIKGEGGGSVEPSGVMFEKAASFESGKYIFVVEGKIAVPIAANKSYGQMYLDVDAEMQGDKIVYEEESALIVEVANGKATMKDAAGRYYGMDETHLTSFQLFNELNNGCYWTAAFEGDKIRLTNNLNTNCFIAQNANPNYGGFYNNIAPGSNTDPANFKLPVAYKMIAGAGVEAIESDNNVDAPVVYFNLQGQRVANPENGLYIRVQGNKVEKVAIR